MPFYTSTGATMKVKLESTTVLKPTYAAGVPPPPTDASTPLSVFDKVSYNTHIAVIYAFRPPTPPNSTIITGLATALGEYREWAGQLTVDDDGNSVILLNDAGVKLVQATVETTIDKLPFKPSPVLLSLHPPLYGADELVQVQLTRFACGSLVVGFTAHHLVADGHATSNFLVAWGRATRGLSADPFALHDRTSYFLPRDPPEIKFEHRGVELVPRKPAVAGGKDDPLKDDVIVHKAHFTKEFLNKLKLKASAGTNLRPYSTFESLVAHLWRVITKARGLGDHEITQIRISVNGRSRLIPKVPNEYFGNLVLWAFPRAKAKELTSSPLGHAAKLIHEAVAKVDVEYFKSFIDFASSPAVAEEKLVSTADMSKSVLCPNLEVDSWLRFPFYELDFGGGSPYYFMPTYFPVEGMMFLLPSFIGDGSIDAFVPLFEHNVAAFKQACYSME